MKFATLLGARGSVRAQHDLPWPELCAWLYACQQQTPTGDKDQLPAWIPADTSGREDRDVREITLAVLDFDKVDPARFAATLARLAAAGIAHCAYGTPSYPCQAPRGLHAWRLVLPLLRPIPAQQWRPLRAALVLGLGYALDGSDGCDRVTSNPARIYFLPCGQWAPSLDVIAKHGAPALDANGAPILWRPFVAHDGAALDLLAWTPVEPATSPSVISLDTVEIPAGERHDRLFRVACSARARGLPVAAIVDKANARCKPPMSQAEITALVEDVCKRYPEGHGLTDTGNAELFAEREQGRLLFCEGLGGWHRWSGAIWEPDTMRAADRAAIETVRSLYATAQGCDHPEAQKRIEAHARSCESAGRLAACVSVARGYLAETHEAFDRDPYLLVCRNATLDLRTLAARQHDPKDRATKCASAIYDPAATAPTWERFLSRCWPDPDVREYLQRFAGYCLSGDTREQSFLFLTGVGANGKSVLIGALYGLLGTYAQMTPPGFLIERRTEPHPTELFAIRGTRALFGTELPRGAAWAEERIKAITGGDAIRARKMHCDFVDFRPTCKLIIAANHRPSVSDSHSIWRRMRALPCDAVISDNERDVFLSQRLAAEYSGILNWCLAGWVQFNTNGLPNVRAIHDASRAYREEQDALLAFLEACTVPVHGAETASSTLHEAYIAHCRKNSLDPMPVAELGRALEERGYKAGRANDATRTRVRKGLVLR